jgi:putative Mg2+ transporter-C (MgtC) family protein
MGFLGAGAIIKGRGSVRGLTTAAGLWLVTAIGLTVGAGLYSAALLTTLISLPILYNLRLVRPNIRRDERTLLTVRCCCEDRPLKRIKSILSQQKDIQIEFVTYKENREDLVVTYIFRLMSKDDTNWGEVVSQLLTIDSILEIAWEEAEVP